MDPTHTHILTNMGELHLFYIQHTFFTFKGNKEGKPVQFFKIANRF